MENSSNIILLYPHKLIKKNNRKITKNIFFKSKNYLYAFLFLSIIIIFAICFFIFIFECLGLVKKYKSKKNSILNFSLKYDEFNETINKQYIQLQNLFCQKIKENLIQEFEHKIKISNVKFNGKTFDMFVYKGEDIVSNSIKNSNKYEGNYTLNILNALEYYRNKNNLENEDIYVLDIGSNVGWYTYFLGKYGFKILSFEANKINTYILYKNYCLNKNVKATIINKGLDLEEKSCYLKIVEKNQGDGITYCENLGKLNNIFDGEIFNDIELTKLDKYIKFLVNNNLALIKIDVEGAEGNVILGGK